MAIKIDIVIYNSLPQWTQTEMRHETGHKNGRGPISDIILPLNAELLERQRRIDLLTSKSERLQAERDALVRKMSGYIVDAARYRWLRDFSPMFETVRKTKENIDAAIDAARGDK